MKGIVVLLQKNSSELLNEKVSAHQSYFLQKRRLVVTFPYNLQLRVRNAAQQSV